MVNLKVVKNRKIWLSLSALLMATSIVFIFLWGFNFGIDFTGGSLMEVKFSENSPSAFEIRDKLNDLNVEKHWLLEVLSPQYLIFEHSN